MDCIDIIEIVISLDCVLDDLYDSISWSLFLLLKYNKGLIVSNLEKFYITHRVALVNA